MKRETRDGVFLTMLAVVLVAVICIFAMWMEKQRAAIWAEEMRKAGVPAGVGR